MKTKKLLSLISAAAISVSCFAGMAVTASAADVNDVQPINNAYTFIADNYNSNGTVSITNGTLMDDKILSVGGNNAASNKNTSIINGKENLNSMRLKGSQNALYLKVGIDATITLYGSGDTRRCYVVGTTCAAYDIAKSEAGASTLTFDVNQNTGIYLTGLNVSDYSNGDLFLAGFTVTPKSKQTEPVSGEYTASWTFRTDSGCPAFNSQGADTPIEYSTTTADNKIATMSINTKNGKLANANWGDWTQMNGGTTVTIPAYYGMKITWDVFSPDNGGFSINGKEYKSGQYVYTGTENTLTLTAGEFSYIRTFAVEPAAPVASTVDVSDVEVFADPDKASKATVFNATVYANDFAVTGLKFENNDEKKATTEIAQGSTALFVVVYEGLATKNPVVTPIN